jgi:cytochrome c oxidase subunit 4
MADRHSVSHAEHEKIQHHSHAGRYLVVWIALLVLTVVTWLVAKIEIPGGWNVTVALVIAVVKGGLVVLFFMHLWDQRGANRLVFVTCLVFVALIVGFTAIDYATRWPFANPPGSPGALPAPDFDPAPFDQSR